MRTRNRLVLLPGFVYLLSWALIVGVPLAAGIPPAGAAVIEGVAAFRGELQQGVRIWALPTPAFDPAAGGPVSPASDLKGKFSFTLDRGRYYLVAFKKGGGAKKGREPGDYYCFYSGNPVTVGGDEPLAVGFNLIRLPDDGRVAPGPTGVDGTIIFEGKPLGRSYLYLYQNAADDFHGMGFSTMPVGPDGRFKARLPPGTYYFIARQRQEGGMYGPLKKNDRVGYYYANPLTVQADRTRTIILEVVRVVDNLEESGLAGRAPMGYAVTGTVHDPGGKPLAGLRVLLYGSPDTSGKPRFVSGASGGDGSFRLEVPAPGSYYLVARKNLGGPPEAGEYYSRWEDRDRKALPVTVGPQNPRVSLTLTASPAPVSGD